MASTKVLISYARADGSALAERIRNLLRQATDEPWLDVDDLPDGAEWEPALMAAISKTDVLIVIMTPAASRSEWVQKEVEYALSIQKRTVALKYHSGEAPIWLQPNQFIDNPDGDQANTLARIVRVLKAVWDEVKTRLDDLTDIDERFAGLVDKLKRLSDKRAKMRPEGFLACAEILERANADLAGQKDLEDVVEKLQTEAYLAEQLNMERAYRAHRAVILQLLSDEMKKLPLPPIEVVAVVPIVMTQAEAQQLIALGLFDAAAEELRAHFTTMRQAIEERDQIMDWANRYGDAPEDWRPFAAQGPSLAAIFMQELRQLSDNKRHFRPKFVDVRTLNDPINRSELKKLRKGRCVVVMDVLSVCHPVLFDAYRRTLLDVFPQTLVIKVAPASAVNVSESELVIRLRERMDVHFYDRFYDKDPLCVVTQREVDLRRELYDQLAPSPSDGGIRATYRNPE